jgi:hypothetical protein
MVADCYGNGADDKVGRGDGYGGEQEARYPDRGLFERPTEGEPERDPPKEPGRPVRPPKPGKWSEAIKAWIAEHEREDEDDYEIDANGKKHRRPRRPRPYLDATSSFGPQISALAVGEPGTVSMTVSNDGNCPAWTCYVEVYEGPGGYTHPLSEYEMRGQQIVTLHPGEKRVISLPWVRQGRTGRVVGLVYDPLLDARGFAVVEQYNRHITSIHFTNLD